MGSPPPSKGGSIAKLSIIGLITYIAGVFVSPYIIPIDFISSKLLFSEPAQQVEEVNNVDAPTPATPPSAVPETNILFEKTYKSIVQFDYKNDPFDGVDIVVHRNDPCSRQDNTLASLDDELSPASRLLINAAAKLHGGKKPLDVYDKYDFDSVLTHSLAGGTGKQSLLQVKGSSCGATWNEENHYLDKAPHLKKKEISMIKFCDMGIDKTPIQLDHDKLISVPEVGSMPCHFHTREGVRITSLEQLADLARDAKVPTTGECTQEKRNADGTCSSEEVSTGSERKELHLYAVQAGRQFIFAPKYVGEIFELPHVKVPRDLPVWLEVISLSPRVFDVFNFFDREESAAIVDKALKETSETHRIKRSSTGANGYNVNSQRTSENGFDTHGTQAQAVKRRCMNVLGFDEYQESLTDGLQVLRYNKTTAYVPHLDWIDDYQKKQEHDFDTEHLGSNRFATILLYMTDLNEGDGGETVFTHGWPVGQAENDHVKFEDAKLALRESGDAEGLFEPDSWQENMVARCRSRLSIRPHSSRAVLFYSQNPDGTPDNQSLHGGCPVIKGEKWAANLWVWNAPRGGFPGSPVNKEVVERNRAAGKTTETNAQKKASFTNTKENESMRNAELFFQDTFWGKLGYSSEPLNVNTYEGHQWNVKVNGDTVETFVIDKRPIQRYTI